MAKKPTRVYADTSIYGGVFDQEFEKGSRRFFEEARAGVFQLVVSSLVEEEIENAPSQVRDFLEGFNDIAEYNDIPDGALRLQKAYLSHGVVGSASIADALHVALATVLDCRVILSWNFKHIVNFRRIPLYNGVNKAEGYSEIAIHTPLEVLADEN